MVIKGCSLMDSNPGFGKNPQQAAAMPSNKIIKVMMLGVKPKVSSILWFQPVVCNTLDLRNNQCLTGRFRTGQLEPQLRDQVWLRQ